MRYALSRLPHYMAGALAILAVGQPASGFALPLVGNAQTVVRDVLGITETVEQTIYVDSEVFQDEEIVTGPKSATRLIFKDGTNLEMGENSRLKLTRLVFDPDPAKSKLVVKAAVGVFRWTSGNLPHDAYQIGTPVATIGIRGTSLDIIVADSGLSTVALSRGAIVVSNLRGDSVALKPGEATTILPPNADGSQEPPTPPGPLPPDLQAILWAMTVAIRNADPPSDVNPGAGGGVKGLTFTPTNGPVGVDPPPTNPPPNPPAPFPPGRPPPGLPPLTTQHTVTTTAGTGTTTTGTGTTGTGTTGTGTTGTGTTGDGTTGTGATGTSTTGTGTTGTGTTGTGTTGTGTTGTGTTGDGTTGTQVRLGLPRLGLPRPGLGRPELVRLGLRRPGLPRLGLGRPGLGRPAPERPELVRLGLRRPGLPRLGLGRPAPARRALVRLGPARLGLGRPARRALGRLGPARRGLAPPVPGRPGPAQPAPERAPGAVRRGSISAR